MNPLDRLLAIEDIRRLKARYFLGVDGKDAALLRSVFADGAETDFRSESPTRDEALRTHDPEQFARNTVAMLAGFTTAHRAGLPDIEFVSDDEARAVWPMSDRIWLEDAAQARLPFKSLRGWGHYHDRYVRTAQGWRIAATRLERSKVIVE